MSFATFHLPLGAIMNKPCVMITGASSGIGLAAAKKFNQAGYPLLLLARRLEIMKKLNLSNTLCRCVDVKNIDDLKSAISAAEHQFGVIDCLINNAGVLSGGEFTDINYANQRDMVEINLQGVINTTQLVLKNMQQHQAGTIINISSIGDRCVAPAFETYCATKAAVRSLSHSLQIANKDNGIRVCCISPAYIETPIWNNIDSASYEAIRDAQQTISAEQLAEMLLW